MKREQIAGRNVGIDILKCICAFMIVCIHCPFPHEAGQYFISISRIAVPVFFMITGYFYHLKTDKSRKIKQIKKIFLLGLSANIIFFVWKCFYQLISGGSIAVYIRSVFTLKNFIKFAALNESPFGVHLWYLGAILYVLVIIAIAQREKITKFLYLLSPFLLMGDLILGKYSLLFFGREFPYIIVRNFLFVGIPYFCIGMWFSEHKRDYNIKRLITLSVIFSLSTIAERFFLVSQNINGKRDHYLSTTFLAISVFLVFVTVYQNRKPSCIEEKLAFIGRELSTWIYIIHPIFVMIFSFVSKKAGIYGIYKFFAPVVVFVVTMLFVAAVQIFVRKIKKEG